MKDHDNLKLKNPYSLNDPGTVKLRKVHNPATCCHITRLLGRKLILLSLILVHSYPAVETVAASSQQFAYVVFSRAAIALRAVEAIS
jgi:hypothetical protein